ncbi:ABC transporter substrate-binding protein [Clostridium tyrobutyricum]|uniref:ABC transporter, substrate-binding protein, putative n=1 Tax=Clostridium tyrobutyricum DIVETGP TaxID=1408889 RepID=W6N8D9_CLOTY|nr:ABC transporter substrate-binding protein [Clostridium tyrobutyricum]AND85733.1 nitrate ABC transporter substrate-binding protein [Clostridium tyrobutyricum]ANP70252.1 nitrate ABC transporter substrate-binding protein [Clostridium tyrobutyricum]MBV4428629.1 ABC transporter substrate-binding protein [Clostridium tyrobutyricum]MBV4434681.1 ABC transporter substrate-binding protein [Clostridium tyrobutyricum]MBV4443624.1 ABC transporter substrate-binding protein [Clostridium tyrobutyricum]
MKKHKVSVLAIFFSLVFVIAIFSGCSSKSGNNEVKKIRLNEVARSVFYAPMYAAVNQGFFKEQGLELDITTGQGADKTMQTVLSKNADIGFCGPEQVIYIYNQKRQDYPILFAQMTTTDGSFLVGREQQKNFEWKNLKGKTVIGGRPGGVPEMALEYAMKKNGIKPGTDVNLITNLAFTATSGAFKAGTGDYVALFEPTASMLEKSKSGYIVSSVGEASGKLPYTCYFSTKSYMEKNPDVIKKFTKAIYEGQVWVQKHNDEEVANAIKSFFPGTDMEVLKSVVKNYRSIGAYAASPEIKQENLDRLMDIIQSYKSSLIPQRPAFNKIVDNSFAKEVVK